MRIAVLLDPQSTEIGRSAVAQVGGVDNVGSAMAVPGVTWQSTSPAVASISSSGVIVALSPGVTSIIAASGTLSAAAEFVVRGFTVPSLSLRITPGEPVIPLGGTIQLSAVVVSAAGDTVPAPTAVWATSQPELVSVSASGFAIGLGSGSAVLRATANGLTGSVLVTVRPIVDPGLEVHIAAPIPNAILGDLLHIVVTVIKNNQTAKLAKVEATIDNATVPLDTVALGALGGVQGWGKDLPLSNVPIGIHRLIVAAYSFTGETAADTVWFDRQVPQTGGTPPVGGKKQIRPLRGAGFVPDSVVVRKCLRAVEQCEP